MGVRGYTEAEKAYIDSVKNVMNTESIISCLELANSRVHRTIKSINRDNTINMVATGRRNLLKKVSLTQLDDDIHKGRYYITNISKIKSLVKDKYDVYVKLNNIRVIHIEKIFENENGVFVHFTGIDGLRGEQKIPINILETYMYKQFDDGIDRVNYINNISVLKKYTNLIDKHCENKIRCEEKFLQQCRETDELLKRTLKVIMTHRSELPNVKKKVKYNAQAYSRVNSELLKACKYYDKYCVITSLRQGNILCDRQVTISTLRGVSNTVYISFETKMYNTEKRPYTPNKRIYNGDTDEKKIFNVIDKVVIPWLRFDDLKREVMR